MVDPGLEARLGYHPLGVKVPEALAKIQAEFRKAAEADALSRQGGGAAWHARVSGAAPLAAPDPAEQQVWREAKLYAVALETVLTQRGAAQARLASPSHHSPHDTPQQLL